MIVDSPISDALLEIVKKKLKEDDKISTDSDKESDDKTKEIKTKKGEVIIINPDITGQMNSPSGGSSAPDMTGTNRLSMA